MNHPLQPQWTEKAKTAMQEKARSGTMPGCAPIGYINKERFGERLIEPDPKTAWMIEALFILVGNGYSLRKAGRRAFAAGLRSRNGKVLGPSGLHAILTNPFYVGMIRYKGELIQGKHQAIISQTLFKNVKVNLEKRNKTKTPTECTGGS